MPDRLPHLLPDGRDRRTLPPHHCFLCGEHISGRPGWLLIALDVQLDDEQFPSGGRWCCVPCIEERRR